MNLIIDVHFEAAIRRCNDGIALLSFNNFEGATASFSSSLRLVKEILCDPAVQIEPPENDDCPSAVRGSLLDCCMDASSGVGQNKGHTDNNAAASYIYHQAIRFLPNAIP
jgi:hypothetical protein